MANSKPPLPPPAVAYLVELTEDQGKTQDSAGPQVTQDQLVSAFAKMIPPNDSKEVFEEKVRSGRHNDLACIFSLPRRCGCAGHQAREGCMHSPEALEQGHA